MQNESHNSSSPYFFCRSLQLAGYLKVCGAELLEIVKSYDGEGVVFKFTRNEIIKSLLDDYDRDEAKVEPKSYNKAISELRLQRNEICPIPPKRASVSV